jgi:hypothetical protein
LNVSNIGIGTVRNVGSERSPARDSAQQAAPEPQAANAQCCEESTAFLQEVQRGLELCARDGARAALLLVELEPQYVRRAAERIHVVLAEWSRRRAQPLQYGRIDDRRYGVFIAPLSAYEQPRQVAESLAHALDPRVCPLLRRALPYARWGIAAVGAQPFDARELLARAEQYIEHRRNGSNPCRSLARARRRHTASAVLQPLPIPQP